jgi:hypothetical protein
MELTQNYKLICWMCLSRCRKWYRTAAVQGTNPVMVDWSLCRSCYQPTVNFTHCLLYGKPMRKLICKCFRAAERCLSREECDWNTCGKESFSTHIKLLDCRRSYLSRVCHLGDRMMTASYKAVIMSFTQQSGICTSSLGAAV